MKLIIAGSRGITDYELVKWVVDRVINFTGFKITEVVSGKALGVDTFGEDWANENHIHIQPFKPDWTRYGYDAGFMRNHEMGDYADILIAIWDDKSSGTKDMMNYMKKLNKPVFYYSPSHPDPIPSLFSFFL